MVSIDKISRKLIQLDEYLGFLKEISNKSESGFLNDKILIGSAKYYLQVSIECCLDIANHIIASERLRAPKDYADSFSILGENDNLEASLVTKLRQMAKFRNRLVHLYGDIDDSFVYDFIKNDIADIKAFQKDIVNQFIRSDV